MSKGLLIVAIAGAGIAAFSAWQWAGRVPEGGYGRVDPANAQRSADAETVHPGDEAAETFAIADQGSPGSMQASLLNTTEGNRRQILALTIVAAGYPCPLVKSAKPVGSHGLDWRVHCGDARVYWVEVDEFDRLSVAPVPYGDIGPVEWSTERVTPVSPLNERDRSLELIQPDQPR